MNGFDRLPTREVLVVLLVIGTVSAALGVTTWAYFQDSASSSSNTLQGGTLDATIDGSDSVSGSFSITDGAPGDSASHNYTIKNVGSASADHAEVSFSFSENDPGSEPSDSSLSNELNDTQTASHVEVTQLEYQNASGSTLTDLLGSVTDDNGNGIKDLEDVKNNQGAFDDLTPPSANGADSTYLVISVRIANDDGSFTGTDEDVMADGIDVTVTVTLNQDSSQ